MDEETRGLVCRCQNGCRIRFCVDLDNGTERNADDRCIVHMAIKDPAKDFDFTCLQLLVTTLVEVAVGITDRHLPSIEFLIASIKVLLASVGNAD